MSERDGCDCDACTWTGHVTPGPPTQHETAHRLSRKYLPGWRPPGQLRW